MSEQDPAPDPASYDPLERQLADHQAEGGPPPDWEARVWAQVAEGQSAAGAWWRWLLPPLLFGAATVAFLLWPSVPDDGFTLQIKRGVRLMRGLSAAPGDELVVRAGAGGRAHVEVRVYRGDTTLVGRCVGAGDCRVELASPGAYRVLLVRADVTIGAKSAGLDDDLGRARAAGADVEVSEPVDVR